MDMLISGLCTFFFTIQYKIAVLGISDTKPKLGACVFLKSNSGHVPIACIRHTEYYIHYEVVSSYIKVKSELDEK